MENINRGVEDSFYRYKMPKLQSKIEGNGNGIKTVIPNMKEIAKALSRSPEYTTKFFGFELGAQTILDDKNSRYIINGAHQAPKLAELLDVFIKKFVLCAGCGNPETEMIFKNSKKAKEKDLYLSCKACGKLTPVDPIHKLTGFILKNPPAGASSSANNTPQKKKGKKGKKSSDEENEGSEVSERESSDLQGDSSFGSIPLQVEEKEPEEDPAESFAKFISEKESTADEMSQEAERLGLNSELAAAVMIQVLLEKNLVSQFKVKKDLLKSFAFNQDRQKGYLGGLERLLAVTQPDLLPKTSQVLKLFYDSEILEEEVILQWADKPTKKYVGDKELAKKVRASASQMVDWLRNAEEESEEDDD